eukprot:TRINITY_DN5615_c0_g1_i3.p2 TRINITY_DN5615_c0_g1~~TRINITY_DN5615_c0_g1_i3.p2  ORF type:complete len:112 (+),score=10.53 TRINITY_DN5615_c0_g1_i3:231-566(+)
MSLTGVGTPLQIEAEVDRGADSEEGKEHGSTVSPPSPSPTKITTTTSPPTRVQFSQSPKTTFFVPFIDDTRVIPKIVKQRLREIHKAKKGARTPDERTSLATVRVNPCCFV